MVFVSLGVEYRTEKKQTEFIIRTQRMREWPLTRISRDIGRQKISWRPVIFLYTLILGVQTTRSRSNYNYCLPLSRS